MILSTRYDAAIGCTDSLATPKPPWKQRKQQYLAALAKKDPQIKLVWNP